jgi:hypothetical protein
MVSSDPRPDLDRNPVIGPTPGDVGCPVAYHPRHGEQEFGVITAFNRSFVFVRYVGDTGSKATLRKDLLFRHRRGSD